MGLEPTTFRLEVERAIQLRYTDICSDSDSNRDLPRKGPRILTIECYQNTMIIITIFPYLNASFVYPSYAFET